MHQRVNEQFLPMKSVSSTIEPSTIYLDNLWQIKRAQHVLNFLNLEGSLCLCIIIIPEVSYPSIPGWLVDKRNILPSKWNVPNFRVILFSGDPKQCPQHCPWEKFVEYD
jgi:hypothetical protein